MPLETFHPLIRDWFVGRFGEPTEPQRLGWPQIADGRNTLIAAPTGSGKTLAAFLYCIDRLFREGLAGELTAETQVVYISPLKALSNDIRRNLELPLEEIRNLAVESSCELPPLRAGVRTGDTPASERQKMLKRPPHILVTTPESLYILLTSVKGRETLRNVGTVIVDEIHALARDKRGSHLVLTLERLDQICKAPPARIGLSATQRPINDIARFLVGAKRIDANGNPDCAIVDVGHQRHIDMAVEVPPGELSAVCSLECWEEIYERIINLITAHRSTLVFVNTRKLSERIAHRLSETLGPDAVASHHGSLSRTIRQSAERRLKEGKLKAIVATASLEMGIDIGYIDLVIQIGSPRSIATFLQRIGRSGHSLGAIPKGRLFPLTRDELLECLALVRAAKQGKLDQIEIPVAPLDILAQQIVAAVANEPWAEDELYQLFTGAWPYRDLKRGDFDAIVRMLHTGVTEASRRGAHLHRDAINGLLRARRGARIAAITSGGAIPENADFRVFTADDHTYVGTVNEDFAIESNAGDIFLLGNTSWRVHYVRGGEVIVSDAHGAPATVPFWLGEAPGRTIELSAEVSKLREEIERRVPATTTPTVKPQSVLVGQIAGTESSSPDAEPPPINALPELIDISKAAEWLESECGADEWAAEQASRYVAAEKLALGLVPTQHKVVFERFFDESGGMQLVVHAPWGARINRAWGLALRKRFCRSFDFELQASADDNGVVLSLGPQHSFPIDALFNMLNPENAQYLLEQALLAAPMFQTRWRWNASRALAVLRMRGGKRVPPQLQRLQSDDLLAAVFPETVGCLENHHGDIKVPDHPLVHQTMYDCLHEAMDLDRWINVLADFKQGKIEFIPRDTWEPSPFSHERLNAQPYAFLDDAPLEERRSRAVQTRRTLSIETARDLGRLDAGAIDQVTRDAWPIARNPDELHDALLSLVALPEDEGYDWADMFQKLVAEGRAATVRHNEAPPLWVAAERWPALRAILPSAAVEPALNLPPALDQQLESAPSLVALVRGRLQATGPTTADKIARRFGLEESRVEAALVALEGEGTAMRGQFTPVGPRISSHTSNGNGHLGTNGKNGTTTVEWCERRLLARIHRLTLDGLRRQIQPVSPTDFVRFLLRHHRMTGSLRWRGAPGTREVIGRLQGFEMPAGLWEQRILPPRIEDYDSTWLDDLSLRGEAVWGRLRPPRKDEDDGPSSTVMTRAMPISLFLRQDLPWLLAPDRANVEGLARANARIVVEALGQRGALFHHELLAASGLLPAHLDDALYELAALGLITADGFGAVRQLVPQQGRKRADRSRRRLRRSVRGGAPPPVGRWSLFPGSIPLASEEQRLVRWAELLLARWGVVFRDILERETVAPPWGSLVGVLRRMELRGEVRGGRFVSMVAGEQYATGDAVERLRQVRDEKPDGKWTVISAADPLNLTGIITDEPRISAIHTNLIAVREGRLLASQQGGELELHADLTTNQVMEVRRAFQQM